MSPWLKAGIVGAVVMVVLTLMTLVPVAGMLCCALWFVAYAVSGALAAHWMPRPRIATQAAAQGAGAAALAAFAGGLVWTLISAVTMRGVDAAAVVSQMPDFYQQFIQQQGITPEMLQGYLSPGFAALAGGLCCGGQLIVAALVGAVAGAIVASVGRE
jgi:hypothetical protein